MRRPLLCCAALAAAAPSFQVANNQFELNGQEITLFSGSFHYHRAHSSTWRDRLSRMAAMGLNAVQFYIPWNYHEVSRGQFDWGQYDSSRNLSAFLSIAQELNMLALVRAGPYICGEHDLGGFPARLLNISGMVLRTNNAPYLTEVDIYWASAMAQIKPHLVSNGGNVAMVQIENEFGSYGNTCGDPSCKSGNPDDLAYMRHLKDETYAALGGPTAVQLYTTDGGDVGYFVHGALPGEVFVTGDGGPDIDPPSFWAAEDQFNPEGQRAHTDSEYYTGWLTHWGETMANTSTLAVVSGISVILANNGSFNLYMAYGGTNWGFHNGANGGGTSFTPVITSYDYNSPIAEGGAHGYSGDGDKFLAMRRVLAYWAPMKGRGPLPAEPPLPVATAYPSVQLTAYLPLLTTAAAIQRLATLGVFTAPGPQPASMESYGLKRGYALLTTPLPSGLPAGQAATLTFGFVGDMVYTFCTTASQALLYAGATWRADAGSYSVTIPGPCVTGSGGSLTLLLQTAGHVNYGHGIWDPKGLFPAAGQTASGPVATVKSGNGGAMPLPGPWTITPMEFEKQVVASLAPMATAAPANGFAAPAFYYGTFSIAGQPTDTYMTLCGWGKGTMWVNGNHVGRYWEVSVGAGPSGGPQHAFYVPAAFLNTGANNITVFEEVSAPGGYTVGFTDGPDFTGAVCKPSSDNTKATEPAPVVGMPAALPAVHKVSAPVCPSTPSVGQDVSMQTCGAVGGADAWAVTVVNKDAYVVVLQSKANPALCLSVNDTAAMGGSAVHRYNTKHRGSALLTNTAFTLQGRGVDSHRALQNAKTNVVLAPCAPGLRDMSQHFMYFEDLPARALMSVTRGNCLDIYGGSGSPGTQLEVYGCTGNTNQGWTISATSGQVTSLASGLCIAACDAN